MEESEEEIGWMEYSGKMYGSMGNHEKQQLSMNLPKFATKCNGSLCASLVTGEVDSVPMTSFEELHKLKINLSEIFEKEKYVEFIS